MIDTTPTECYKANVSFARIGNTLKRHYSILQKRINHSRIITMHEMYGKDKGPVHARSVYNERYDCNATNDFAGCYVLIKDERPFYVGISQKIFNRLNQHVKGNKHSATLAAKLAEKNGGGDLEKAKECLLGTHVAIVEIDDIIEKYLFEVYAAVKLKTGMYNKFQTH